MHGPIELPLSCNDVFFITLVVNPLKFNFKIWMAGPSINYITQILEYIILTISEQTVHIKIWNKLK